MKQNNKKLYEKIIYNVSKQVKQALFEDIQNFDVGDYHDNEDEIIDNHDIENMTIDKSLRVKALASILDRTEKTAEQIFDFIKKHENDDISKFFKDENSFMQNHGIFILFMIAVAFENEYANINDEQIRKFANTYKIGSFNPYDYSWFDEDDDVDYLIELLTTKKMFKNRIKKYVDEIHNNIRSINPGDIFNIFQVWPEPIFKGSNIEELEDIIENGEY